jgi:hypothetical protein
LFAVAAAACVLIPRLAVSQSLSGSLIGTVKDEQGGSIVGVRVRMTSPAMMGGPASVTTDEKGQWRFPALPPGRYVLDADFQGFTTYHEENLNVGSSATIERAVVLTVQGMVESVMVEGSGSQLDVRNAGFGTRFGPEDLKTIPTRRASMFDVLRAAPGVSPTSPSSGTTTTVSAFGSGTNENQFLIDGTNFTCPCNGIARAEPGVDFIQEVQLQSVGASAEFGNTQGAVINVVMRQGSARLLADGSIFVQVAGLTSQPMLRPMAAPRTGQSGYERVKYRDATTTLGGPAMRDRLWFFAGYQYLRDVDSQPGSDPAFPRIYEQNKIFAKLTWRLASSWNLAQSYHQEFWVNPDPPTAVTPFEATLRRSASVPAITFGTLTHTLSPGTVWDVRVGRFVFLQDNTPSTGIRTTANRFDSVTGLSGGAPPQFGSLSISRTTAKTLISHFRQGLLGADHDLKMGGQVERGGHDAVNVIPTGVRFVDSNGQPSQRVSSAPSHAGGMSITAAAFASDAVTLGDRLTISAGVRFDHTRAFSQDLAAIDVVGNEIDGVVQGLGRLYTWNLISPRLGLTAKLSADGRTVARASYGRFRQGVLTGELEAFHPGTMPVTTAAYVPATGAYTRIVSVIDNTVNLEIDPDTRAPRTDELSVGLDRELGRRLSAAIAYIRKDGTDFIGWTDVGGVYREEARTLPGGSSAPVFVLVNPPGDRRYRLTNPDGYSLTYNGLVVALDKRRAHGWQAFGSYTFSRVYGLQASSGTGAAAAQTSTVSPPQPLTFGRDPNDLTHARGRLPNDRPHVLRLTSSVELPKTGVTIAGSLGHFSGKPWAATAQIQVPQNNQQRVLLEARGARRLASQSLLDVRISKTVAIGGLGRIELLVDVLNALNETAEEGIASDNVSAANFGRATLFVDPRRVMFGAKMTLGRQ